MNYTVYIIFHTYFILTTFYSSSPLFSYPFLIFFSLLFSSVGIDDVTLYSKAREILLIMGEYFQIQDDYLGNCHSLPLTCNDTNNHFFCVHVLWLVFFLVIINIFSVFCMKLCFCLRLNLTLILILLS